MTYKSCTCKCRQKTDKGRNASRNRRCECLQEIRSQFCTRKAKICPISRRNSQKQPLHLFYPLNKGRSYRGLAKFGGCQASRWYSRGRIVGKNSFVDMARLDVGEEATGGGAKAGGGRAAASVTNPPSNSRSVTETVNGSHQFTINGYSLAKGMGVGKYIASETFSVGGYQWAIYFYPDGKNPEDNSLYVSLFIALASEGMDVRALFELTLSDQSGRGRHKVHSHFDRALESGPYTLKYRGSMWGYKRFFRRAALEMSDFIKDDSLSINCTVGVVVTHTDGPKIYSIPVPRSDLGQQLGAFLDSGEGTDVSFEVDDEIFRAHKIVLAARSPVFKAQLFGPMRDRNTENIKIEDMEAPVFKAMLHFIYQDALPDTYEVAGSTSMPASTVMAQHLLAAADRYGLDRLRLLCEAKLCEEVSNETVATTLALAEQHHSSHLKSVCLKFAASPENLGAVMLTEGFEYLKTSCPSLLSELLKTVAQFEGDSGIGSRNRCSVWAPGLDGSDINGRRLRQRT